MAEVMYVICPRCGGQFSAGPEFFTVPESYCHCPYCAEEFSVYQKTPGSKESLKQSLREIKKD
ncbi:MAG: hypothetical protein HY695_05825 [Deltaproteobacteria bacterium]|nr:hypothetical protein [Deltaproteobacteria bacterium]